METSSLPRVVPMSSDERPGASLRDGFDRLIGSSPLLVETVAKARLLAGTSAPLLLWGETGVGKEVFAHAIHDSSPRKDGPFVPLNCGGLPRELLASELFGYSEGAFTGAKRGGTAGKLQAAHGGTLFLDEIAEMPLDLQPYLLRALEGGEFYPLGSNKPCKANFRLVAACNRNLRAAVSAGRFRMDLFYRVSVTSLQIPALRERIEDLPALLEHFVHDVSKRHGVSVKRVAPEVMRVLCEYTWPGNIREFRNVVESIVLLTAGEVIDLSVVPAELYGSPDSPGPQQPASSSHSGLKQVERTAIGAALREHGGNLTRAAQELRIARSTLYLKLKRYDLESVLNDVRTSA